MREVKWHNIDGQSSRNLDDLHMAVFRYWYSVRSEGLSLESLQRLRDEILDYVAVQSLEDPTLSDPRTRAALRTAAEFDLGVLDLGCFPTGDFEIRFLLIDERISNFPPADGKVSSFPDDTELFGPAQVIDPMPTTARTWLDTYAICLVSGLVRERFGTVGPGLRGDYAPAIRDGVPYSPLDSVSDPAERAEMDTVCLYFHEMTTSKPSDLPDNPVRKPTAHERSVAAQLLDTFDDLSPEAQLLRTLLDDDQPAFEQALTARLEQYRTVAESDGRPRSLLPIGTIAVAALAVQAHGWELGIRSGYLPNGLLRAPGLVHPS
jgi:hypothetical protein